LTVVPGLLGNAPLSANLRRSSPDGESTERE